MTRHPPGCRIAYGALGDTAKAQKEVDILTRLDATQGEFLKRTSSSRSTFMLSQKATNDATIDRPRMVFKFSGKDMAGKTLDPTADEFDGAAQAPF